MLALGGAGKYPNFVLDCPSISSLNGSLNDIGGSPSDYTIAMRTGSEINCNLVFINSIVMIDLFSLHL